MQQGPVSPALAVLPALPSEQCTALVMLAMNGTLQVTHWCDLMQQLGERESAKRAWSTTSFRRRVVLPLMRQKLVEESSGRWFDCAPRVGSTVLRWAGQRGDVARLMTAGCHASPYASWRSPWHYPDSLRVARLAIFSTPDAALASLEQAVDADCHRAAKLAAEVTDPHDSAWFGSLPEPLRARLLELALVGLERTATRNQGLFREICRDLRPLDGATEATVQAFAGVAVLTGEVAVLRALAEAPLAAGAQGPIRAALAVVEGRYEEAAREAESWSRSKKTGHCGVLALLAVLALLRRAPQSELASRLVKAGGRRGTPLQQTFRIHEAVVAADSGRVPARIRYARDVDDDVLSHLWLTMLARLDASGFDVAELFEEATSAVRDCRDAGYAWLAEQYEQASWQLFELSGLRSQRYGPKLDPPPPPSIGPPVLDACAPRQAWELALDRLEALSQSQEPGETEAFAGATTQIVWRYRSESGKIEPFLQKRAANGRWTKGRKLAVKHLLGDSPTVAALPREDQSVAAHARQERTYSFGYAEISEEIDARAWLALVGHPRVFVDSQDVPREVIKGEPRLSVEMRGGRVRVATVPPRLQKGVSVWLQGDQLVVYDVDSLAGEVLDALGPSFEAPKATKHRVLKLLERIAPVIPVESFEQSDAKSVPTDSSPHVRLIPSRGGLAVTLLVRPLGSEGALVTPGRGAPTLLGRTKGEPVQVERDFVEEERRANEVIEKLCNLAGCEAADYRWQIDDPESCLELLSALREIGDEVTVHWPAGTPLRLRGRLSRQSMKGALRRKQSFFSLTGSVRVDGELSVELEQMIELVARHPGRFVQLASGEYVELEHELRELLDGVAAARSAHAKTRGGVAIVGSAISVIEQLTREGGNLALDKSAKDWRSRFDDVFATEINIPKSFQGDLREYQVEGFRWLARLSALEFGACLADDMGLGKTVQIIALLLHRARSGPALIVAPTSVCENWRRELNRFGPSLASVAYSGTERERHLTRLKPGNVVITSYTLLQKNVDALSAIQWSTAVLDEAQMIKNADTLRAKAAHRLEAKARIIATGTPIENHAGDVFSLFQFLNPGLLGSARSFSAAIGAAGRSNRGPKRLLKPFVLRRTKNQVLDDLPPVTTIQRTVVMSPGEAKLYNSVRQAALDKLDKVGVTPKGRLQIFTELTRLRRLCCHPGLVAPDANLTSSKLESFLELAEELVAGRHRCLVFSQFTDVLALVRPLLDQKGITYQYLDGSTAAARRGSAVDAFQAGEGDLFLISLRAGGFGLNLTAADYVIHLDPWWNPAVEAQASDRAHRIGQTRPVTIYRLVTADTIEDRIVELHAAKRELADAVLAEADVAAKLSADEMRSLLERE